MLSISALSNTIHISTHTPLLPSSLHVVCTHTSVSCSPHRRFHMFTTLDLYFSTTYSQHSLSLAIPPLFFILMSATQHYPLYDTTTPEHDHGYHASVYLTSGTFFRYPPRLHLLVALPCNLFAQPPTFFSFTRHYMRLHAHGIH